jgi:predicted acetyltransferase
MTVHIRTIGPDELAAYSAAMRLGFLVSPDPASTAADVEFRRPRILLDRTWGAFDGERCVGTFRSHPFELTVPFGATVSADGVTNVTVAPTHRRQGLLTRMMAEGLRAAASRGDPVSILISSEYPIYGRYGYAPATEAVTREIRTPVGPTRPRTGTVEQVEVAELRRLAPAVYDRFRATCPGALSRGPLRWDADLGLDSTPSRPRWKGWAVLHRDTAGELDGYLRYHVDLDWNGRQSNSVLRVDELVAITPAAYADLWRYCLEVDLVTTVHAADRPADEPLPWLLTDGRAVRSVERTDFLWLRLLDVPAALSARGYPRAGRLVLQVTDPSGYAAGRFALDATPDGATCQPTTGAADLTLPAAALAAAYLGGFRLRTLAAGGQVDEHTPGALATADLLFLADQTPWCTLWF